MFSDASGGEEEFVDVEEEANKLKATGGDEGQKSQVLFSSQHPLREAPSSRRPKALLVT
jgi:hypothetical protein